MACSAWLATKVSGLPTNPFANSDLAGLDRLATFEQAFRAWIGHARGTIEARLGECLISAIVHGGLVSSRCWQPWLEALIDNKMDARNDVVSIPYSVRDDRNPDRLIGRRWFADPITTAILRRVPIEIPALSRSVEVRAVIDRVRTAAGLGSESHDEFLAWFEPAIALSLRLRVPAVLAEQALLVQDGHAPRPRIWATLGTCSSATEFVENRKNDFLESLPEDSTAISTSFKSMSYKNVDEKNFNAIYNSIINKLPKNADGNYQTGNRHSNASAVREGVRELLGRSPEVRPGNIRESILGLLFRLASAKPKDPVPRLGTFTLNTILRYISALSKTDWQDMWMFSLPRCEPRGLFGIFAKVIEAGKRDDDGSAYGAIRRPDTYICHHWPHIDSYWEEIAQKREEEVRSPAVELISGQQFARIHGLLNHHPAGARDAQMCRLASTLMFRAGLRGQQEVRYLRVGDIETFGDIVELTVRTNADVATKNRTSYRRIPLDILFEPAELHELLQWRARRIVEGRGRSLNARLFDDSDGDGDGLLQARLLVPIEHAIMVVIGEWVYNDRHDHRKWTLGGALRHSFCSYLLATLLLPEDESVFSLPEGIGIDLVSNRRRAAVAVRLMGEGAAGQTAVHAVSTLMGHAHVSRLLNVYAHLMDWSLASYLWRWSGQKAIPPELVQRLILGADPSSPLALQSISKTSQRRWKDEERHLSKLKNKGAHGTTRTVPPLRGKVAASYKASKPADAGSVYIDHFRDDLFKRHRKRGRPAIAEQTSTPVPPPPPALPAVERIDHIDAVMTLARRGVAATGIADFVQLDVKICEEFLIRAALLSRLKRGKLSRFPAFQRLLPAPHHEPVTSDAPLGALPPGFRAGMLIVDQDAVARAALVKFFDKAQFGGVGFRMLSRAKVFFDSMVRLGVPKEHITLIQTHARAGSMGVATSSNLEGRRFVVRIRSQGSSIPSSVEGQSTLYGLALIVIGSTKIDITKMGSWSPPTKLKQYIG